MINFTVTPEGLQDQLLAEIVEHEVPEVEHKRRELVRVISKGRLTLVRNEDSILALLNSSQGYLLDDVELIRSLRESKQVDETIKVGL